MAGLVLSYWFLFLIAIAIGFVAGAALHRTALAGAMADMDGDVQALRVRLSKVKAPRNGA